MLFTASLHPSQTWLLRQLSFSSQRVTGKHILQDPLVTVSRQDWGTSTLKCLLSIAKAAPPAPATRGAESSYIPDPLSHPSLLLLPLLLPPRAQQQPAGQQSLHLASLAHPQPPSCLLAGSSGAGFPSSVRRTGGGTADLRERRASLSPPWLCSGAAPVLCPALSRPVSMPAPHQLRHEAVPLPRASQPHWDECLVSSRSTLSPSPRPRISLDAHT